jgi:hypothetical protein
MKKVSNTMPTILLRFAAQSCLDCGFCLLACCTRHTFDSKMPSIDMEPTILRLHEGEVGIPLISKVSASMKSNIYLWPHQPKFYAVNARVTAVLRRVNM